MNKKEGRKKNIDRILIEQESVRLKTEILFFSFQINIILLVIVQFLFQIVK